MCWAGCNRLGAIAAHLGMDERAAHWSSIATAMQARLLDQAWNEKRGAFAAAIGIDDLDASVLLLPEIGLLETRDLRFVRSVEAIERELLSGNHIMRYASEDDFGLPETAFLVCRFWLIDVLWDLGRREQAREMFNDALKYQKSLWSYGGRCSCSDGRIMGQFPPDLFHGRLILTAMRLSRNWEDRFWRGWSSFQIG
jgi:GH15 family glucan-1,4-alpha-glucosidase